MASGVVLAAATGNETVDEALRLVVAAFEACFPRRIRAYYVHGSHADRTGLAANDVDLTIVFKGRFSAEAERAAIARSREACARQAAVELDFEIVDEEDLARGVYPDLKLGGRCVWGEDRRDQWPLISLATWTRERMHAAYWLIVNVFGRPPVVDGPLAFPDPAAEFYGYTRRTIRLPDGSEPASTRDLIRVTGWAATALLALRAGRYVARKRDCHLTYQRFIGDEWAPLLAAIYDRCRGEWGYLLPADPVGRQVLHAICARTLAFENHFMAVYRDFLLAELRASDPAARLTAVQSLGRIHYRDEAIRQVVQPLVTDGDAGLRTAAAEVLARYDAPAGPGSR